MIDSASAVVEFNVNYEQVKHLAAGKAVNSDAISVGGHMWRISYYPNQFTADEICIALKLVSKSISVHAIFEVMLLDEDGIPALFAAKRTWTIEEGCATIVRLHSATRTLSTDLVQKYMKDGQIKFLCTIRMLHDDNSVPSGIVRLPGIHAPSSDMAKHIGTLLDTAEGSDVSFTVEGETFRAHRAILAARSPVFQAELFGSMAEATMTSITLHHIAPSTFKAMLWFIYNDALPEDMELVGNSPLEMFEHLLAAADRYALDRLKILCARKLWDNVSVDTVASMLACAQMYSCPDLKDKCIGFFAVEKNFKKSVLTEGYVRLVHQFPSIIFELRD
jgi:speckle-type POZ protein